MTFHPKLLMGAGIAIAGLGLVGAGAGATFTAQVAGSTEISSGGVSLSLNGKTGSDLQLDFEGQNIDSHFAPVSQRLVLKNTGTLDLASTYLDVMATGCDGGEGAALAKALNVRLTEVSNKDKLIYDGDLCSLASNKSVTSDKGGQGFVTPPEHNGAGGQLPHTLRAGHSAEYLFVIQPDDSRKGLPDQAQSTSTSLRLVFSGFDY